MQGIFAQTGVAKKALSCRKTADYAEKQVSRINSKGVLEKCRIVHYPL